MMNEREGRRSGSFWIRCQHFSLMIVKIHEKSQVNTASPRNDSETRKNQNNKQYF